MVLQVSKETGEPVAAIQTEAAAIFEEMAHRLQLSTVRFFAFALSKAFKTLFKSICVNEEGLQRVSMHFSCQLTLACGHNQTATHACLKSLCEYITLYSHAVYCIHTKQICIS